MCGNVEYGELLDEVSVDTFVTFTLTFCCSKETASSSPHVGHM